MSNGPLRSDGPIGLRDGETPLRIAHLASLHFGELTFDEDLVETTFEAVAASDVDLVVVAGDLTAAGYDWEYEQAISWLDRLDAPVVVVPGNHDSRNVGYVHFERRFGPRFSVHRFTLPERRAERLRAPGVTLLAADSSEPDLDEGHIGREWYDWVREGFADRPDDLKILALHHHLVAVPGAGRDLNVVTDAGDLLPVLNEVAVDVVLSGHKHVPYFWGLNGMLIANCGTAATRRLRGRVPPSWNELSVDAATIKVHLRYEDGRRELSVIRNRTTQRTVREAFQITDAFYASNHLPVG